MKTSSTGLQTLLASSEALFRFELLTITLQAGSGVYRYNSSDVDLVYNGHTWFAGDQGVNPGFKRGSITTELGTDTKSMDLTLFCGPTTKIGGVLVPTFADYGGFDNAIIEVDCLPVPVFAAGSQPDTSRGTYNIWTGIAGDVTADRTQVQIQVSSLLRILQGAVPRNYTLPTCNNTLFDAACTLLKANYAINSTVSTTATSTTDFKTGLTNVDDYFDLGWLVWTSGQNNGLVRTIKTYKNASGEVTIIYPLPYLPQAGDAFTIYPGCDKTQSTCTNKFNNVAHFRGFPYMPNPLTLFAGLSTGPVSGAAGAGGAAGGDFVAGPGGANGAFKQQ